MLLVQVIAIIFIFIGAPLGVEPLTSSLRRTPGIEVSLSYYKGVRERLIKSTTLEVILENRSSEMEQLEVVPAGRLYRL